MSAEIFTSTATINMIINENTQFDYGSLSLAGLHWPNSSSGRVRKKSRKIKINSKTKRENSLKKKKRR